MFGRKKEERPKRGSRDRNLAQFGLFDVPSELSMDGGGADSDDEDDEDLEAELAALTGGGRSKAKPAKVRRAPVAPVADMNFMVKQSLRDIPSDEDLSGDDNDPDLLNELSELTQEEKPEVEAPTPVSAQQETDIVKLLEQRLEMYVLAETNAKKAGETSRARRFNRGIKTLKDLLKQAKSGKNINNDDIPPEVSTAAGKRPPPPQEEEGGGVAVPIREAPPPPPSQPISPSSIVAPIVEPEEKTTPSVDEETVKLLTERMEQYRIAAVVAKRAGDMQTAIAYMKTGKQFNMVLQAVKDGQPVDLSAMPGPPAGPSSSEQENIPEQSPIQQQQEPEEEAQEEVAVETDPLPVALQKRLAVYKAQEETAKQDGNSSKVRRMGRIVKQYEQAVKAQASGRTVALDELPNPPGFPPLVPPEPSPKSENPVAPPPPSAKPSVEDRRQAAAPISPPVPVTPPQPGPRHAKTDTAARQTAELQRKQREFREAAIEAKKRGELAQAKEYLRAAKGFDRVIEAARCGLPVDMDSLPIAPSQRSQLEDSFDFVSAEECTNDDSGTLDMLSRLEEQLTRQLKLCLSTRDHHKALGDVAGTNRFEHLALSVTKDLDIIRLAKRTHPSEGGRLPRFRYENKSFSVVRCCTDLTDNDLELTIVRGININCANPKDIDTYVKFEFPYPQEEPVRDRTIVFKDSNNPEYNAMFTLPIQRTSRPCVRVFKRQAIKFEIYSKGGFFRGDTLIGTVSVKLQPLETQCELHDSYDLMDGRKKVGGKLEIRIRVRNPLVAKQIEQLNEKWLIIEH